MRGDTLIVEERRWQDMAVVQKITPCLWFDNQAEEAAKFYVSIFENSGIETVTRYGSEGFEKHGKPAGSVLTVTFRLEGQTFTALNGGPQFTLSPAISLVVHCESQHEVDHFWGQLGAGGDPTWQACGWLKDRFGLSWQIVPEAFFAMLSAGDSVKSERAMKAIMQMKKLDLSALQRAYDGR
jgi:predicted 3-demethylubiquinone-9 3-methyltransferase (glyoxalase superfamily)